MGKLSSLLYVWFLFFLRFKKKFKKQAENSIFNILFQGHKMQGLEVDGVFRLADIRLPS